MEEWSCVLGTSIALGGRLEVDHLETYTSVNIFFLKAVIVFLGIFLYIGGFMRKVSCLLAYYFSLIKSQDLSGLDNNLLIIDVR